MSIAISLHHENKDTLKPHEVRTPFDSGDTHTEESSSVCDIVNQAITEILVDLSNTHVSEHCLFVLFLFKLKFMNSNRKTTDVRSQKRYFQMSTHVLL